MENNGKMLSASIVVAALIIGGSVLYKSNGTDPWADKQPATGGTKVVLNYVDLAEELDLNTSEFKSCLSSPAVAAEVDADYAAGEALNVEGTPATFINGTLIAGAYPYAAYKKVIDEALLPGATPGPAAAGIDDDVVLGNPQAPVTMVIFGDYQCPFCERAFGDAEQKVRDEYVTSGKVKMVFRDYPLNFHDFAKPAAIAAECAGKQGKYWEYHDELFKRQSQLGPQS